MATSTPHDALVKEVFSDPENAAAELRAVLPAEVAAQIAWDSLRLEPGSFVKPDLASRHTDLLFRASLRDSGEPALLYVLFEHQRRVDARMPLRLLGYMVRIWEAYLKKAPPGPKRLPPILPFVLANAERRWTAPVAFVDGLEFGNAATRAALAPYVPAFSYVVDDLSQVTDEELRARAVGNFARLALLFLQHARNGRELVARLAAWGEVVAELVARPDGLRALDVLVRYLSLVTEEPSPAEFRAALASVAEPHLEETIVTWAETWKAEGEAKGRAEGEAKGRVEGQVRALLSILAGRGLEVSATVRARIEACSDLAMLERWIVAALRVSTAEELLES